MLLVWQSCCREILLERIEPRWNPTARRFLQMDSGRVETTGQLNADFLEDRHAWERFRVVDAGNGMVALHNYDWNRYVRMIWNGQQHAITVSSVSPDDARVCTEPHCCLLVFSFILVEHSKIVFAYPCVYVFMHLQMHVRAYIRMYVGT